MEKETSADTVLISPCPCCEFSGMVIKDNGFWYGVCYFWNDPESEDKCPDNPETRNCATYDEALADWNNRIFVTLEQI